jgi:charged multivesicular body protein 3
VLAVLKISGTLEKSTEILKLSNALIKLPELNKTMMAMSSEMLKAGLISEMVDDAMEGLDEDDELEDEADEEVERVLFEITDGKLGEGAGKLPTLNRPQPTREETMAEEEETAKMQRELNALLGN